jgi:hypothetical protein
MLGDYLESRRTAYSLEQWYLDAEQLNGSLDGAILLDSCTAVGARLAELATFLQGSLVPLRALREKDVRIHQDFDEASPDDPGRLDRMEAALANLDEAWHRESEAVGEALRLYSHYLASSKRIAGLAGRLIPVRHIEPIHPRVVRNLVTLIAQPMQ